MKSGTMMRAVVLATALAAAGCGGGSSGGTPPAPPAPTTATVKVSTSGALASGVRIGGVDVKLVLPAGVTLGAAADATNPSVLVATPDAVKASGGPSASALVLGVYTPAAGGAPGSVVIHVADGAGFGAGELATVTCALAAGSKPASSDFSLTALQAVDLNGAAVAGLQPALTATLQ